MPLHVRLQPADRGGCGQYRLRWPAAALADHDATVEVHETWPEARRRRQDNGIDRILSVDLDTDVIVFQRPMLKAMAEAIPVLQAQGVAVVVELDDDFGSLPQGHPAKRGTSMEANPIENRWWLRRCCQQADLVTVSTPALAARYGAHGRCIVLPNCVPERYLSIVPEPHEGLWVGWTGSTVTHVDDLRVCGSGVRDAIAEADARCHVIGTGVGVREQLQLDDEPSVTGWVEIDDYPARYAELDVGVIPLSHNAFNDAKSWLKGIEAAALGVPFVASPTGPYRELVGLGAGLLAGTEGEWRRQLRGLLASRDARRDLSGRGRVIAAGFTIEGNAWRWAEAWELAMRIRQGKKAA